jgi:hypothetical protein
MQFFTGIEIDGSSLGEGAAAPYEQTVSRILYDISFAGQAGRAVLRPFRNRELARPVRIVPWNQPGALTPPQPDRGRNEQLANMAPAGTPLVDEFHPSQILGIGTGWGLHVLINYSPNTLHTTGPGGRRDEALVHELVHAIRAIRGHFQGYRFGHHFGDWEEFFAILVSNIYISELQGPLRGDHRARRVGRNFHLNTMSHGQAAQYANDPEYAHLIEQFIRSDPALSADLAAVPSQFNPIRDHLPHV